MKKWLGFLTFLLTACTVPRQNPVPPDQVANGAFEYCDGGLWGYVVPLTPEPKHAGTRLAVFFEMRSILEKDPSHALTLHVAIRAAQILNLRLPDPTVRVSIDQGPSVAHRMSFVVTEFARSVDQLYPFDQYDAQLLDSKTNRWAIWDRNSFFRFIRTHRREVILPVDRVRPLTSDSAIVAFDAKNFESIYVTAAANVWPANTPLKNARLTVRVPALTVGDTPVAARDYSFAMNHDGVLRRNAKVSTRPCPSTDSVFFYTRPRFGF